MEIVKESGHEHVVESGHTLSVIAQAYGTTVDAIKKSNDLKSDVIYVGQNYSFQNDKKKCLINIKLLLESFERVSIISRSIFKKT